MVRQLVKREQKKDKKTNMKKSVSSPDVTLLSSLVRSTSMKEKVGASPASNQIKKDSSSEEEEKSEE